MGEKHDNGPCALCQRECKHIYDFSRDIHHYDCISCGKFGLNGEALDELTRETSSIDKQRIAACTRERVIRGLPSLFLYAGSPSNIPYVRNDKIWHCPSDVGFAREGDNYIFRYSSYLYNWTIYMNATPAYAVKKVSKCKKPSDVPTWGCVSAHAITKGFFYPTWNYAFLDGHVDAVRYYKGLNSDLAYGW